MRQFIYEQAVSEMYGCDPSAAEPVPRCAILDPLLEQLAVAITTAGARALRAFAAGPDADHKGHVGLENAAPNRFCTGPPGWRFELGGA